MFAGISLENTPDFEYVFEDTVKLPEFELYHIGYGIYRFEQPLNYGKEDFGRLVGKYSCLRFFYRSDNNNEVTLLFVMSAIYNITNFYYLDGALENDEFAKIVPKEYDERIDRKRYDGILSVNRYEPGYDSVGTNRLLGFRWIPEQYYDLYGRRRYIMIQGRVAKLIATGLYAFQEIQPNDTVRYDDDDYGVRQGGYPLITEKIYSNAFHKCAVIGEMAWDEGRYGWYLGTKTRYIAFDDIGINFLKRLYEYTVGYEYKDMKVVTKEEEQAEPFKSNKEDTVDIIKLMNDAQPIDCKEREQEWKRKKEEKKNAYQIGANAVELIKGIGYRDIAIFFRVLFHADRKATRRPEKYDFVYIEDGMLKLVRISADNTKAEVSEIPVGALAELFVVKETEICFRVREEIPIKVIDNTYIEQNIIGMKNYDSFKKFIEKY